MVDSRGDDRRIGVGKEYLGSFCSTDGILFLILKKFQSQCANYWYLLSLDDGTTFFFFNIYVCLKFL